MTPRRAARPLILFAAILALGACRAGDRRPADADRDPFAVDTAPPPAATRPPPPPPSARTVRPDILMIDDAVLTADEVLYPLRDRIAEAQRTNDAGRLRELLYRWVHEQTQQEIGAVLLHAEATRRLEEPRKKLIADFVEREVRTRAANEFAGSTARLEAHLRQYGLTLDQYRRSIERSAVAQEHARERYLPEVHVRRQELVDHYEKNRERFSTPGSRELSMITIPYASKLPPGRTWNSATEDERAAARAAVRAELAAAHAALATQPFEDVARQFSRGPMAAQGGAWGPIGRPLQAPYDVPTQALFTLSEGAYSGPIETDHGGFIVKCGRVQPEVRASFTEVQEEVRRELVNRRIAELSERSMRDLLQRASITTVEPFVAAAVERAATPGWPNAR